MNSVSRFHGDQLRSNGALDFAVSIWPAVRPPSLEHALNEALRADGYPDEVGATSAVASRYDRPPEEALLLNGASEAFWLIAHSLRPNKAVCIHPSFTEPEAALRAIGTEVLRIFRPPEKKWRLEPETVPEKAEMVCLCNPNNPTGTLDAEAAVLSLARTGRTLLVDESFMDFVPAESESLAGRRDIPGLIVLRSLTKIWSLAGVRAGYLLAAPEIVAALSSNRQPWGVNALACAALVACGGDFQRTQTVASEVGAARQGLIDQLQGAGIGVWPSAANFLLIEVPQGPKVVEVLRGEGILVRPAETFPGLGPNHIRVAVRRPEENRLLVDALIRVIVGLRVGMPENSRAPSPKSPVSEE